MSGHHGWQRCHALPITTWVFQDSASPMAIIALGWQQQAAHCPGRCYLPSITSPPGAWGAQHALGWHSGITGGGWCGRLAQLPLLCPPHRQHGHHIIAGVPSSLLQAHFPVLHLAHVPAGHRRLLCHDVPHQPCVSLGEPGLPPPSPPRPSLPLTQQHLGLHQPGPHLSSGKCCPPVVPLWARTLVSLWQLSYVLGSMSSGLASPGGGLVK